MNPLNRIQRYFFAREQKIREFIFILYAVGIAGTAIPLTRDFFILLTPFVLFISLFILFIFHERGPGLKVALVFLSIFIVSFAVEAAGVATGKIFGSYTYGSGLGIKLFDTPLLIGFNWILLVYCTSAIFEKVPVHSIVKITGASLLMVIYDLVMEQVAPVMDMWSFEGGTVPAVNYLSWFVLAFIFHSAVKVSGIRIANKFGPLLFWCQGAFFLILLVIFKLIL